MTKKHILFLPKWYPNHNDLQLGIFIKKHALAVALKHQVTIIYPCLSTHISSTFLVEQQAITPNLNQIIIYYKSHPSTNRVIRKSIHFYRYWQAFQKGWLILKENDQQIDLAHVHVLTRPALLALYLKKRHHIPYIITEHWSGYLNGTYQQQSKLKQGFMQYLFRQAQITTVVSPLLQSQMQQLGIPKVAAITPNIIENDPKLLAETFPQDRFIFGVVADLTDSIKNISGLLRSMQKVKAKNPKALLLIIGGGQDAATLQELATDLALTDIVIFKGRKENQYVLRFLNHIDCLVINSRYETFSMVTAEAMMAGKPVISSRCGGPEQFIDQQTGILVDVDANDQLTQAMLYMMEHYTDYHPTIIQQKIGEKYGAEKVGTVFNDIYAIALQ